MNITLLYSVNLALQSAIMRAEAEAQDNDGEISEYIDQHIEELEIERDELISGLARIYKSVSAEASAIKQEESTLKARRQRNESFAEKIKQVLSDTIGEGDRYQDSACKIGWRKSESCRVVDDAKVPEECIEIVRKVRLSDLKKMVKSGTVGSDVAELVTKHNIQIV